MRVIDGLGISVPNGWDLTTLSAVTSKIGSGATPRGGAAGYVHEGPALIRSQNVHDNRFKDEGLVFLSDKAAEALKGVAVLEGDVLINITGDSILRTCVVPKRVLPARVNQHVAIIRSNGQIDPGFLQKWLSQPLMKDFMLGHSSGGTRKAITKGHLQSFPVPLPPIEEQRGIARTFGALEERIASNQRIVGIALRILDALASRASTELPAVPLGSLVTVVRDSVDPTRLGTAVVDHFSLPAFDEGARPDIVSATSIMSNKLRVTQRTILISRLNPRFNRTWWAVPRTDIPALSSTEFAPLTAPSAELLAGVWLAVRDEFFQGELARRVTGTSGSHQRVRPDDLLSIEVPDVSKLTKEVRERALGLLELAEQKRNEVASLERLRDMLLPDVLSGWVKVPQADEVVA